MQLDPAASGARKNIMIDYKKLQTVLVQCEGAANLTAKQMENAMVNIDRLAPNFGASHNEFRSVSDWVSGQPVYADVTVEQFAAFVANKQKMLANNAYLLK